MKKVSILVVLLLAAMFVFPVHAENGKISGKVYYDFTLDLSKNADNYNAFEIHRVYFGYEKQLNDNVMFKLTTDVGREGSTGKLDAYLKYAYVDYKTSLGNIIVGLQSLNIFNVQEHMWGYRFIEKSPMDLYKWASSADLGIGYKRKFGEKAGLSAIISNGPGYKKSENDKYKKYSVNLNFGESKLAGKDGYSAGVVVAYEPYEFAVDTVKGKTLFGAYGAYAKSGVRVGAEFDMFKDGGPDVTKQIISAFAVYKINDKTELLARVDMYDPNTDVDKDGQTYVIAGASFVPSKGFYVAPNLRFTAYQADGVDNDVLFKVNFQFNF